MKYMCTVLLQYIHTYRDYMLFMYLYMPLLGTKISHKLPTNQANTVVYLLTGPLLGPLSGPLCQVRD